MAVTPTPECPPRQRQPRPQLESEQDGWSARTVEEVSHLHKVRLRAQLPLHLERVPLPLGAPVGPGIDNIQDQQVVHLSHQGPPPVPWNETPLHPRPPPFPLPNTQGGPSQNDPGPSPRESPTECGRVAPVSTYG